MIEQHRTMEVPGAGIVRDAGPTTQHSEYPKHMRHPAYRRGKPDKEIKVTDENGQPTGRLVYMGGESIRLPPVLVLNEAQEEYHKSQGYETVGKSDPAAFARLVADAEPVAENYKPIEFPKWSHGKLVQDAAEEADHLAALGIDKHGIPLGAKADKPLDELIAALPVDVKHQMAVEGIAHQVMQEAREDEEDEIAALEARLAALKAKKAAPVVEARIKEALGPTCTEVIEEVGKIHEERIFKEQADAVAVEKAAKKAAHGERIKAGIARKKAEREAAAAGKALQDEVEAEAEEAE